MIYCIFCTTALELLENLQFHPWGRVVNWKWNVHCTVDRLKLQNLATLLNFIEGSLQHQSRTGLMIMQGCRMQGPADGPSPQILTDQLTLSQPGGHIMLITSLLAPPPPHPPIVRLSYGPVMLGFSREIIFIFHVSRHPLLNLCKINLSMLCKKSTHVVWYYVTNPSVTSDKRLRLAEFRGVNKQDQRSIKMAV